MNRRGLVTAGVVAVGASLVQGANAQGADMGKALAESFAATLTAHDIDGFAALFAETYLNHQASAAAPAPPGINQKQAVVAFFAARLAGIPDLKVTIETMISAADKVAASFVYSGTHGGTYFGVPPTGRALRFTSCDIFSVRNNLFVEHWGMGDIAGTLAQIRS